MKIIVLAAILAQLCHSYPHHGHSHPLKNLILPRFNPYDPSVRPDGENGPEDPVVVTVNMFMRDAEPLESTSGKEEIRVQVTFRQSWKDPRLNHGKFVEADHDDDDESDDEKPYTLVGDDIERIWRPDTFFRESRDVKILGYSRTERYARISPDGTVLLSERLNVVLSCPENHSKKQTGDYINCKMSVASYGMDTSDMVYLWKKMNPALFSKDISYGDASLLKYITDYANVVTSTAEYSTLTLDLQFQKIDKSI